MASHPRRRAGYGAAVAFRSRIAALDDRQPTICIADKISDHCIAYARRGHAGLPLLYIAGALLAGIDDGDARGREIDRLVSDDLYTRLSAILRALKTARATVDLDKLASMLEMREPEQMRWASVLIEADPRRAD